MSILDGARWIWCDGADLGAAHQWVEVRREFAVGAVDAGARLCVAVDSDYCLWVNGRLVDLGAYGDWPRDKHYDVLDVGAYLRLLGVNCLAVLAYYQGVDTHRYRAGRAGLIFSLENGGERVVSDGGCRVRRSLGYRSGAAVTGQLGFAIHCDGRVEDGWREVGYDDGGWGSAVDLAGATDGYWERLSERPLPKLLLGAAEAVAVVEVGRFVRAGEGGDGPADGGGDGGGGCVGARDGGW